jgi:hypothetical protein
MTDSDGLVLAAAYRNNAEMIADCHQLGYLNDDDLVLDATYAKGGWWKRWQPRQLVGNGRALRADFRTLPFPDQTFDAAAYDPPYCPPGGRATSTIKKFHARYGMTDMPKNPAQTQTLINDGLDEVHRVVRRHGIVLAKCKSYITSGKYQHQEFETTRYALDKLGFEMEGRLLVAQRAPGPQSQKTQKHFRNNFSTLLILRRK